MRGSEIARGTLSKTVNKEAPDRTLVLRTLERITLKAPVNSEEGLVPAGATGTVVHVWASGASCEVEFTKPFHAIATVTANDIVA